MSESTEGYLLDTWRRAVRRADDLALTCQLAERGTRPAPEPQEVREVIEDLLRAGPELIEHLDDALEPRGTRLTSDVAEVDRDV